MKDKALNALKKLRTTSKIKLILAAVLTVAVVVSAPILAWFVHQKQMATMAKIDSPAKLTLLSGAGEDIIRFKMSDIDVTHGSEKLFVFCVEGSDISKYNLQLAHTTNIKFSYEIYQALEAESGFPYTKEDGSQVYYQKADSPLGGNFVNRETYSGRIVGNDAYEEPSYDSGDDRQAFAEPLYWQTSTPIIANDPPYDEDPDDPKAFQNYYILRVSWTPGDIVNDKETDMVYLTAQVAQ